MELTVKMAEWRKSYNLRFKKKKNDILCKALTLVPGTWCVLSSNYSMIRYLYIISFIICPLPFFPIKPFMCPYLKSCFHRLLVSAPKPLRRRLIKPYWPYCLSTFFKGLHILLIPPQLLFSLRSKKASLAALTMPFFLLKFFFFIPFIWHLI